MTVTVVWHDEGKQLLHAQYLGRWTINEHFQMVDRAYDLSIQLDHPYVFAIDVTQSPAGFIPDGVFNSLRAHRRFVPENMSCLMLIGASIASRTIINTARQIGIFGTRPIIEVPTLTDALPKAQAFLNTLI